LFVRPCGRGKQTTATNAQNGHSQRTRTRDTRETTATNAQNGYSPQRTRTRDYAPQRTRTRDYSPQRTRTRDYSPQRTRTRDSRQRETSGGYMERCFREARAHVDAASVLHTQPQPPTYTVCGVSPARQQPARIQVTLARAHAVAYSTQQCNCSAEKGVGSEDSK